MTAQPVFLKISGLHKSFREHAGLFGTGRALPVLHDLNLNLVSGRCYGLVGESGSGKSTLARLLMGLIQPTQGSLLYEDRPAGAKDAAGRDYYRRVQMIFQNPYLSLDPRWTVEKIVSEGMHGLTSAARRETCRVLMEQAGLDGALLERRPADLSGGERQRVAIARALAVQPDFLVLDEPTSQLDVSVQARMLELFRKLRSAFKHGYFFISHDLALLSQLADEIIVLSEGRIVESGPVQDVLRRPQSEYTRKLLEAIPVWRREKP